MFDELKFLKWSWRGYKLPKERPLDMGDRRIKDIKAVLY